MVVTPQGAEDIVSLLGEVGVTYSEDCLSLNVWTKLQSGEGQKAVMVWIHGGGFTKGTSHNVGYSGKYIVDLEDVVVVSIKYV